MDLGLKDRVAIVTGSSRGIGKAAALLFGQERTCVAVTFAEQQEKAEEVVAAIKRGGGEAYAVHLDLTSIDSINGAAADVLKRWGRIDVLVNNAVQWGARRPQEAPLFEQLPPDEWQAFLRANTDGPTRRSRRCCRPCGSADGVASSPYPLELPSMGFRGQARIPPRRPRFTVSPARSRRRLDPRAFSLMWSCRASR
jgi:NAD(P)-dependent dehydrogenase (short-subunit alcohol dehydrogenase family)